MKKNLKLLFLIVIFGMIASGGFFVYQWWQIKKTKILINEQIKQLSVKPEEHQTYTNTEFGFEFRYPSNWILDETPIHGRLRKFRLVSVPTEQWDLIYNTSPPFMLDIVTPDRAERLTQLFYKLKKPASETKVGDVAGLKYEYEFNRQPRVSTVLPLGQFKLILDSDKKYEDVFQQIVSTFKFFSTLQETPIQKPVVSKVYRNIEFSFEFQYPQNWLLYENTFYSPFSKFNLIGSSPEEDGYPNSIDPPLLINIVTPDFANRAFYDLRHTALDITVAGVRGAKYEYEFEDVSRVAVDFPFGEYRILLGAKKEHEDVFNQILATFKFLK